MLSVELPFVLPSDKTDQELDEKEILEEELIEQAIESDASDRYAQDQMDAFKDEGGLAELFNKE